MTNKKPPMMNRGHQDDLQTPRWAVVPLLKYLPSGMIIWECACGKGNLVDEMVAHGLKVKWSDIVRDPREDFFKWQPKSWDIIVTNPEYSNKDKWIARAYALGKPWAMLLPITALGGQTRQKMFRTHGLQVLFMDKRVNFEVPSGKDDPWFATAWFTWHLNLPADMTFVEVNNG